MATNRRTFLKTSGLAALASTTALSGCSDILGGGGGGGGAGGTGSFLYDPSALMQTKNKFYGSLNYAQVYQARQNLPQSSQGALELGGESPISPESIDRMAGVGGAKISTTGGSTSGAGSIVVTGSFKASKLTSSIQQNQQASKSGEYQGYTLYENPTGSAPTGGPTSGSATVALKDGTMIFGIGAAQASSAPVTGKKAAQTMIDASNGQVSGLFGSNQYLQQLSNQFGQATAVFGAQIDPALLQQAAGGGGGGMGGMGSQFANGMRAFGLSMQLNGQTTTFKIVGVYKDAQTAESTQAVTLVNQMSQRAVQQSPAIDSVNASYSGSAVVITLTGKTKALFQQGMGQVPMGSIGGGTNQQVTTANQQQQQETPQQQQTPQQQDTPQQQQTPSGTASGDPRNTVRAFYQAFSSGNAQAANSFIHPDSPLPEITASQMPPESATVTVQSATVVEQTQSRAVVRAKVKFVSGDQEQSNTVTLELRPSNGQWLIYAQG